MSTLSTIILIVAGTFMDPNTGSELMMTTDTCLVRSGADVSYYEIAVLPEGAIVRTMPQENYGQFVAVELAGQELGTFQNITCDIELINTSSEAFDDEVMVFTARKGDKAYLRQIGVGPGKSPSRYRGALLISGTTYPVLKKSTEKERAIQRTVLEIAMPKGSYAFILQSHLVAAPEDALARSNNQLFQAQTSEATIQKFRQEEIERLRIETEKEKQQLEEDRRKEEEEKERQRLEEEQRKAQEEERVKEQERQRIQDQELRTAQEPEEELQNEEQTTQVVEEPENIEKDVLVEEVEENQDSLQPQTSTPRSEVETTNGVDANGNSVWDGTPVSIPEAWSALELAWKSMTKGPILEAEPAPLRREFEALATQADNETVAGQAKRLLEAVDLFSILQDEERKFIELQGRLGQLENDVLARQKLALSRTDLDFVGLLSASRAYDGKPGANGRPRPQLLRLRDPVSQRTIVYLNPKGALTEQLWQLSRNQALVGVSGNRGPNLLGVPLLQVVGTLEVLVPK
ncbi:MAG: hypothetical protein CMJ28_02035 [Phycisphaerae bacterium]|nr:hypothetical protein [Phycisphaerae bacterium]